MSNNSPPTRLIITVVAHDRPGIVNSIAEVVSSHGGNWLESNLSNLRGHFAGVILIEVESAQKEKLQSAIVALSSAETKLEIKSLNNKIANISKEPYNELTIFIEANDREGIVEEITKLLAENNINVIRMETRRESAPMAGYDLFFATLLVILPKGMKNTTLESALESVSDDVMVSIEKS